MCKQSIATGEPCAQLREGGSFVFSRVSVGVVTRLCVTKSLRVLRVWRDVRIGFLVGEGGLVMEGDARVDSFVGFLELEF